jgi:hypothetical protein
MRPAARLRATLVASLLAALAPASQAISYTVQVVALSDQQAALGVQRTLLDEAFPAYVVRATTVQGDIYRVRVGAFANRAAALLYAEALPITVGGPPLPALAEGIPSGVMPLEPRVLAQLAEDATEVLPWPGGIALRSQPDASLQATYRVLRNGTAWTFQAWLAGPVEGAVVRLRNMSLWPSTWEQEAPEVREEYRLARLDALEARLALSPASLEPLQRRPPYGPPYLVVLELVDAATSASGGGAATVIGVASADGPLSGNGPEALALGDGELPVPVEPLYRVAGQQEAAPEAQGGELWRAVAAGDFFLLSTPGSTGTAWKAGVGTPLWSDGEHLLVRSGSGLILYDFVPR